MIRNKRVLCIVPARGDSKGLPGKNIKRLCGKPMIGYTIQHAMQSRYIDRIIVSTDDLKIARVAKQFGAEVPFLRPAHLATDDAGTVDVLLHAIDWLQINESFCADMTVLLHVTSPLRSPTDIDGCIELLLRKKADNVISVTPSYRNPYFSMVKIDRSGWASQVISGKFTARQQAPPVYDMNSSVYVWHTRVLREKKSVFLKRTAIFCMPKERSVDIDDALDFRFAETIMKSR